MDLMAMGRRRRLCWLRANRTTLFLVGMVWLGMIAERSIQGITPWFLIGSVPVFAAVRAVTSRSHLRRGGGARRNLPGSLE